MVSLSMVAIGSQLKSCSLKADNSKMVHCVSESFLAPHIEASIKQNHCPNLLTEAGLIVNIDCDFKFPSNHLALPHFHSAVIDA
jgi:hypothetical protein